MWIFIIFGIVLIIFIILYNNLVNKKNKTLNAFAGIDVLLKKRFDLIPNLVETVKAYAKHEQSVLSELTQLRTRAASSGLTDDEKVDMDRQMTGILKGLMVTVENYPDLKANQNFLKLQAALNEVEEQISAARRAYNATVLEYNNALEMIPTNMLGALMKYQKKRFFEIEALEKEPVHVGDMNR